MRRYVLFIHGAGTGACAADRLLADSLQTALGDGFRVDCPKMPDEENAPYGLGRRRSRGHQFGNDLTRVAEDIRRLAIGGRAGRSS